MEPAQYSTALSTEHPAVPCTVSVTALADLGGACLCILDLLFVLLLFSHLSSDVHYLTNGGGSKAWRDATPTGDSPGLEYYWPGQGFAVFEVSKSELQVSFWGVYGDLLHSLTLKK